MTEAEKPENDQKKPGCLIVVTLIATLVLLTGVELYLGVVGQHVDGYPNRGQLNLYIVLPASLVLLDLFLLFFSKRLPLWLKIACVVFQAFATLFFLFLAPGGV